MSRNTERYRLLASFHGSTAAATIVVGFVNPEIASRNSQDPNTIYDPYFSLMVGLVLLMLGLGWLQGVDE